MRLVNGNRKQCLKRGKCKHVNIISIIYLIWHKLWLKVFWMVMVKLGITIIHIVVIMMKEEVHEFQQDIFFWH